VPKGYRIRCGGGDGEGGDGKKKPAMGVWPQWTGHATGLGDTGSDGEGGGGVMRREGGGSDDDEDGNENDRDPWAGFEQEGGLQGEASAVQVWCVCVCVCVCFVHWYSTLKHKYHIHSLTVPILQMV